MVRPPASVSASKADLAVSSQLLAVHVDVSIRVSTRAERIPESADASSRVRVRICTAQLASDLMEREAGTS